MHLGSNCFIDHAPDWTYGHLMQHLDLQETFLANNAFEKLLVHHGHLV